MDSKNAADCAGQQQAEATDRRGHRSSEVRQSHHADGIQVLALTGKLIIGEQRALRHRWIVSAV